MIHPRSLGLKDRKPPRPVWTCTEHGDLAPGEVECPKCEADR